VISLATVLALSEETLRQGEVNGSVKNVYGFLVFQIECLCILAWLSDAAVRPRCDSSPLISTFTPRHCCETCKVSTNTTTVHCTSCGICIDGFQFHCFFLSTCIGSRNLSLFLLLISFLIIWLVFSISLLSFSLLSAILLFLLTVLILFTVSCLMRQRARS
jgi:hypothetical protein